MGYIEGRLLNVAPAYFPVTISPFNSWLKTGSPRSQQFWRDDNESEIHDRVKLIFIFDYSLFVESAPDFYVSHIFLFSLDGFVASLRGYQTMKFPSQKFGLNTILLE